jgi:hypothetical protein
MGTGEINIKMHFNPERRDGVESNYCSGEPVQQASTSALFLGTDYHLFPNEVFSSLIRHNVIAPLLNSLKRYTQLLVRFLLARALMSDTANGYDSSHPKNLRILRGSLHLYFVDQNIDRFSNMLSFVAPRDVTEFNHRFPVTPKCSFGLR